MLEPSGTGPVVPLRSEAGLAVPGGLWRAGDWSRRAGAVDDNVGVSAVVAVSWHPYPRERELEGGEGEGGGIKQTEKPRGKMVG